MKTFLKVWSILLLVIGGFESLSLLTGGNASEIGQAVVVGIPIIIEAICVLIYLGREKKGI